MAIQINLVSRDEMPEHIDEHYCSHIVKSMKLFAYTFASHSVIISQDNKTKVPLVFQPLEKFDLILMIKNPVLDNKLILENEFKPILVLPIDS
ncbi:11444_t:CDS:2, partial [Gigaspora margarita]